MTLQQIKLGFIFFCLFRLKDQARAIFEATYTHSSNLAKFVFLYKALCAVLAEIQAGPKQYHSFVAAFIGGYLVFGKYNKVNEQVSCTNIFGTIIK